MRQRPLVFEESNTRTHITNITFVLSYYWRLNVQNTTIADLKGKMTSILFFIVKTGFDLWFIRSLQERKPPNSAPWGSR